MGMLVLMKGLLRGAGRETECEVVALRRVAKNTVGARLFEPDYVYTDLGVIEAPDDLPDGEYTVEIAGHAFRTSKKQGLWLSCAMTTHPQTAGLTVH